MSKVLSLFFRFSSSTFRVCSFTRSRTRVADCPLVRSWGKLWEGPYTHYIETCQHSAEWHIASYRMEATWTPWAKCRGVKIRGAPKAPSRGCGSASRKWGSRIATLPTPSSWSCMHHPRVGPGRGTEVTANAAPLSCLEHLLFV